MRLGEISSTTHAPCTGFLQVGIASMLDLKAEPQDVVALDNYVQPVDRGPDPRVLRSWQYQVTGKVAAAQVLQELKAEHIKTGTASGGSTAGELPACMQA